MYEYRAIVIGVVDGDTLDVNIDLGFDVWRKERVRLYGIDSPEKYTVAGKLAWAAASLLLPAGDVVTVRTTKYRSEDKYGRYLAAVLLGDGRSMSDVLIEAGHGVAYFGGAR